jgi:hypothetical protein
MFYDHFGECGTFCLARDALALAGWYYPFWNKSQQIFLKQQKNVNIKVYGRK